MSSKERLDRILNRNTKKTVVVALDHGMFMGVLPGIKNMEETIKDIIRGEPDGILITPGMVKKFHSLFKEKRPSIILRTDYLTSISPVAPLEVEQYGLVANVERALRLGADATMLFLDFGLNNSEARVKNIEAIASVAEACEKVGLPLWIEVAPMGKSIPPEDKNKMEYIRDACRVAAELGADIIKTRYTGNPETFREVVESCPVPITILGGPKMDTPKDVLDTVRGAMDAGASGIVFGRNIWQHPEPTRMIKAIKRIVHENASVDDALEEIET